jgi:hypothetical protein
LLDGRLKSIHTAQTMIDCLLDLAPMAIVCVIHGVEQLTSPAAMVSIASS